MSGIYRIDHKCTLCNSEQLTIVKFRHLKGKLMLFSSNELHDVSIIHIKFELYIFYIYFQVSIWVLGGLLLTYSKVSIANIFRPLGSRALMWIGVMQQVGSFFGAVLFYLIINVWSLFESAPYCPM